MEMTQEYLDNITLKADFWVADEEGSIKSVDNEGIAIKKSKTYHEKYHVNVILETKAYGSLDLFAKGWEQRFPKAVITKGSERVDAYDLRVLKTREKEDYTIIQCVGVPLT